MQVSENTNFTRMHVSENTGREREDMVGCVGVVKGIGMMKVTQRWIQQSFAMP